VLYAEKERKMEMTMSKLHADLRREMLGDLDSTLRASLLDLLGGERPTQLRQVLSAETDGQPTSEDDIKYSSPRKVTAFTGRTQRTSPSSSQISAPARRWMMVQHESYT
jgi:hypothetical protein